MTEDLNNFVGYWTLSNSLAVVLVSIEHGINDTAIVRWSDEQEQYRRKIQSTGSGRMYVNFKKRRLYLDHCMRASR